ncbi:SDR family oxidoreductase [Gordonia sp. PDNC005]|uniref:SDR family oxidoreductase n=1 Tax=Gordonia sp. PDNC005 TaxID=2811424 RepID=UPI001966285C|nr:SDR family oxidoreductase [Gordonia sp. PDNC005]QRY64432.1 SDR family oxidoreductase [Gordonia sp. PDNC005]
MSTSLVTIPGPTAFKGRTVVMSGGSRGIGLAIATELGRRGANIVMLAKTDSPDPRLEGTIHTAVDTVRATGANAIGVIGDLRNDSDIARLVRTAVEEFGGIDICVNNASALAPTATADLSMKKYDLIQQVNARGTFALTQACLPHLRRSDHARVVTLSPPINLNPDWLGKFPGYMVSKYGTTLGFAAEWRDDGIACNCLWPETTIATAAVQNLLGGDETVAHSRSPQIMGDAAAFLVGASADVTGQCFIDADLVRDAGVTDLRPYGGVEPLEYDFFLDPPAAKGQRDAPEITRWSCSSTTTA